MKIAVTTTSGTLEGIIDQRFGRAAGFILYDTDAATYQAIDNSTNLNASEGAGVQTARQVANSGAQVVITGHCGPKAFRVLQAAGVAVYLAGGTGTVAEVLDRYKSGTLQAMSGPDVQGHW